MRRREFVATMLIGSVHALALAKDGSVDWAMNATIIDGCSAACCVRVSSARPRQSARPRPKSMRDTGPVISTKRLG
jgi:hypothetical protein